MHIAVTGASGNLGTAVRAALLNDPDVTVTGVCRRPPADEDPRVRWVATDLSLPEAGDALRGAFAGADAVIHLAWLIGTRNTAYMHAVNVDGSRRVADAAVAAGVRGLIAASSIGVYSPGPKDRRVDESWPSDGVATSTYSQHKVQLERILDGYEDTLRIVRVRPALVLQRAAASAIARYFLGRLVPMTLLRPSLIPLVPHVDRLMLQVVHASDAAAGFVAAARSDLRGALNLAAEPVLDSTALGQVLSARPVPIPWAALRALADITWRLHLQPTEPGWLDLARAMPLMDTGRARAELGWTPSVSAGDALLDLLEGMGAKAGGPSPVLAARPSVRTLIGRAAPGSGAAQTRAPDVEER